VKTPYEGSYFLLLGQVTLVLSALLFGLSRAALRPDTVLEDLDQLSQFYLLFLVVACCILAFAILIGWTSTATLLRKLKAMGREDAVSNKLFTADVAGIGCLFMANNTILFSIVATYGTSFSSFQIPQSFNVDPTDVGAVTASFYLLNALFLVTCKPWNAEYSRLLATKRDPKYEFLLTTVIVVQLFCAACTLLFRGQAGAQFTVFFVWAISWLAVNFVWIRDELIGSGSAEPVPPPSPQVPHDPSQQAG